MKKYDVKHIAYHALVAIYFIWLPVYGVLLGMAIHNYYYGYNLPLTKILLTWIGLNLFMGTVLFIVIQQFKRQTLLSRIILYSYFFMASATVTTVLIVIQ